ncbi:MAG TPA: FixH family protein [Bryobacteraceae bacterium]
MRSLCGGHLDSLPAHANARNAALTRFFYGSAALLFLAGILFADGGTLQFREEAGPLDVTLFSSPTPLRAGRADLSVMVQTTADRSSVQDAKVILHLKKSERGNVEEVMAPATHANATNKLLYAANVNLPSAGKWRIEIEVSSGGTSATASGELAVLPPQAPAATYWGYFALVPFVILLFVFNRWLKRRRWLKYPEAPP